ncbi:MAG: 3-methyl-2-oxobutanoate hydroxymethyltransferase [Acidimicrobiales bacterium]
MNPRLNVRTIRTRKCRDGAEPLVMVTAYDQPTAVIASAAGVDLILVGDTVADNVLGYEDTLQVTIDDMEHHVAAVARTKPECLIVGDMPWMSYHVSPEETVRNAARLIRAGAGCVKLEGGRKRVPAIEAIVNAEIPVMGHVGLTPQSVHSMGGMRVQGRQVDTAAALIADATAIADAGCFAIVIEAVPDAVGTAVTAAVEVPTIGIGAGANCDGQVLVFHDALGLGSRPVAKFVRRYANLAEDATKALAAFATDVRSGAFPSEKESYESSDELRHALDVDPVPPG